MAAIAAERDTMRTAIIQRNAAKLGVPELRIVHGSAPAALRDLPPPDAIFVGGGVSDGALFETLWRALKPGGRLVANAVTVEGEVQLAHWQRRAGGQLSRISVAQAEPVGSYQGWRPLMTVTQLWAAKRKDAAS
jgi:precorrin-6Y C5,15-methyltransferase (decarboxylating)